MKNGMNHAGYFTGKIIAKVLSYNFCVKLYQEQPEVRIKYFVPDEHKSGRAIVEVSGKVKKISATDGTIVMTDGCKIKTSDITNLSILSVE